jgi:hypothetical protein
MVLAYVGDAGNNCQTMPKPRRAITIIPLIKLAIARLFILIDLAIGASPKIDFRKKLVSVGFGHPHHVSDRP